MEKVKGGIQVCTLRSTYTRSESVRQKRGFRLMGCSGGGGDRERARASERKSWIYMHRLFIFYFKSCLHIDGMLNIQHTALHKFISLHQILPLMHINDFIIKPFQCIIYFGWLTHTHSLAHRAQQRRRRGAPPRLKYIYCPPYFCFLSISDFSFSFGRFFLIIIVREHKERDDLHALVAFSLSYGNNY